MAGASLTCSDLLCLPDEVLDMFAKLLSIVEDTGVWAAALARGFISLIPKGERM